MEQSGVLVMDCWQPFFLSFLYFKKMFRAYKNQQSGAVVAWEVISFSRWHVYHASFTREDRL